MEILSRVGVTCFAASYALGVLYEVCRMFWPRLPAWPTMAAAGAGVLAETLFLGYRTYVQGRLPIGSPFDSLVVVSWAIALIYVYSSIRERRLNLGLFLLPLALGFSVYAVVAFDRNAAGPELALKIVGATHGLLLLLGTVTVLVALVFAAMYILKARQLRTGVMYERIRLPSLERLDRLNSAAVMMAWPLITLGIGLGFALRELAWTDPKVVVSVVAWGLFTWLAHYRFNPTHRGRRVAWLTLFAGSMVIFSVVGDPILGTAHQTTRNAAP